MSKLIAASSVIIFAAVWFLLFVIIGIGLGTSFIAAGCALAAGLIAAGMVAGPARPVLDVPVTAVGMLLGIATFVIMAVVLSIPLWIDVVAGLSVAGIYSMIDALTRAPRTAGEEKPATSAGPRFGRAASPAFGNGQNRTHEPIGAR
jgi:hypothetical protein